MLGFIRGILTIPFFIAIYIVIPVFLVIGAVLYALFSILKWIWT